MNRDDLTDYQVGDTIELTADHFKLLRAAWWLWEEVETGAPAISGKRPYGNSAVFEDVIEILGWQASEEEIESGSGQVIEEAREIHGETLTALEIVCFTQRFEPGTYRKIEREIGSHTSSCWELVS
jgi:hypothetical protein